MRKNFYLQLHSIAFLSILTSNFTMAQTIQITGRVLERAAMDPVAGATVQWNGGMPQAVTDSLGRFTLTGPSSLRNLNPNFAIPKFQGGKLVVGTQLTHQKISVKVFDAKGESVSSRSFTLNNPGKHILNVFPKSTGNFFGFVLVSSDGQNFRFKIYHHTSPVTHTEASLLESPAALSKVSQGPGIVNVSITGLISKAVNVTRSDTAVGDIILDYPARGTIGVGSSMPYGSVVLIDGSIGRAAATQELRTKWQDWQRWSPVAIPNFRIARDPEFLNDTNRVTVQSCCNTNYGEDDIQALVGKFQDVQVHVEFIGMGEYDKPNYDPTTPNANASDPYNNNTAPGYINSGVYVASRYEVQIQSYGLTGNPGNHDMGSIVDQYVPTVNKNKANGVWQSYDITFRGARFSGTTMTTKPYMTVWWNGTQIHLNRIMNAGASGTNDSHSGERHEDPALYSLKLQSEGRDVRYRKVWVKKLKIDSTGTNFGY